MKLYSPLKHQENSRQHVCLSSPSFPLSPAFRFVLFLSCFFFFLLTLHLSSVTHSFPTFSSLLLSPRLLSCGNEQKEVEDYNVCTTIHNIQNSDPRKKCHVNIPLIFYGFTFITVLSKCLRSKLFNAYKICSAL